MILDSMTAIGASVRKRLHCFVAAVRLIVPERAQAWAIYRCRRFATPPQTRRDPPSACFRAEPCGRESVCRFFLSSPSGLLLARRFARTRNASTVPAIPEVRRAVASEQHQAVGEAESGQVPNATKTLNCGSAGVSVCLNSAPPQRAAWQACSAGTARLPRALVLRRPPPVA